MGLNNGRNLVAAVLWGLGFVGQVQSAPSPTTGQLLYTTHCVGCHSTQIHWRDARMAQSWDGLKVQVRRWQGNAGLQWSDTDIVDVALYLNDTIYHFPQTTDRFSHKPRGVEACLRTDA